MDEPSASNLSNIEIFNLIAGSIFAELYNAFPLRYPLNPEAFAIAALGDEPF